MLKGSRIIYFAICCSSLLAASCGMQSDNVSNLKGDFETIQQKTAQFQANSQNRVSCSSLSNSECIAGLDKLLQLSTTSLFPNKNFIHIFIKRAFTDVDTNGFVDIDVSATVDSIRNRLSGQPNDFQVIHSKTDLFQSQSKNRVSCSGLTNSECISGLDKMLKLSTTPLFPNSNFVHVFIKHAFDNVDSNGFVDIDVNATVADINSFLSKQ